MRLREPSMKHTEILRTYREERRVTVVRKEKADTISHLVKGVISTSCQSSTLSKVSVWSWVTHPFNVSRCFACQLHKLSQVCHYPSINEILHTEALSINLAERAHQWLSLLYKVKRENGHTSISQGYIRSLLMPMW